MNNFTEPKPITGSDYNGGKNWWSCLKKLWHKYKIARLDDDYETQFNSALAIRIVQKDGGCKISEFPEFNLTNNKES